MLPPCSETSLRSLLGVDDSPVESSDYEWLEDERDNAYYLDLTDECVELDNVLMALGMRPGDRRTCRACRRVVEECLPDLRASQDLVMAKVEAHFHKFERFEQGEDIHDG
jgi:hypothetical protein